MKPTFLFDLLGKRILFYLMLALLTGIGVFLVEYAFVYALQGFLILIGVSSTSALPLPSWIPTTPSYFYAFFLTVGIFRVLLTQYKIYLGRLTNQIFIKRFRDSILKHSIMNASQISSHEAFGLFSDTLSRAGSVIIEGISLIITMLSACLLLIAGFIKAPYEMAIGLICLLALIPTLKSLGKTSLRSGYALNSSWEKTTKILFEGIRHHYFFKAHGLIGKQINNGLKQIEQYEQNNRDYYISTGIKNSFPQIFGIFLILALSFLGINYFKTSGTNLIAFLYIFLRVSQSGSEAFGLLNNIIFNAPSLNDLSNWMKKYKIDDSSLSINLDAHHAPALGISEIKFENVSFSYNDQPLLKNISFKLVPGDVLLIEAPSGSGKSTLIGLILKISAPLQGKILFNERNLQDFSDEFRDAISYVGPEPFLFNTTVRENLTYGIKRQYADDEAHIWSCLKLACAETIVNDLDQGLDEILNEHTQLSTGQKQRLSLARALIRNPDVLILDESTANLDGDYEKIVKNNLTGFIKDKICIIIAHKGHIKELATQTLKL